ncbi:MAG: hypothetical protein JWO05_793 [Gemmatimonadetes bacterium]|nr:hypothetical protein [Gemmatimonadota bacterium]
MLRSLRMSLVMLVAVAIPALSQAVAPGDRVRVTSLGKTGIYEAVKMTTDSLSLREDEHSTTFTIPIANVSSLDVSRGRSSKAGAFFRGAGVGFLVGAVVGGVGGQSSGDDKPGQFMAQTASEKALELGVVLGIVGGAIGGVINLFRQHETWQPVPLR